MGYRRHTPARYRSRLRRVIRSLEHLRSVQLNAEASPIKWRRADAEAITAALAALRSADP